MSMVEQVAKALAFEVGKQIDVPGWHLFTAESWKAFVPLARATIAAMRAPSDAISDAIYDAETSRCTSPEVWQRAIDAALASKE